MLSLKNLQLLMDFVSVSMPKPKTKQERAWEDVVKSLRIFYLQGNSHIDGIEDEIDKWIVSTLDSIRKTGKSKRTAKMVSRVVGRENTHAPRCVAH